MNAKVLFAVSLVALATLAAVPAVQAKEVSGKIVAVYHEPVKVNKTYMDKVSVTVDSCAKPGEFETVHYRPGSVSDDNSLGYLFNHSANAARSTVQKNQYMNIVTGHATFMVNDSNTVSKTTFWGYNWECGKNVDETASAAPAGGSASYQQPAQAPAAQQPAAQQQQPAQRRPSRRLPTRRLGW